MVHKNPKTSVLTAKCTPGDWQSVEWTNELEWVWVPRVRDGGFVVLIISLRGCFMYYKPDIAEEPDMSEADLKSFQDYLIQTVKQEISSRELDEHGARAYIIGPAHKAGQAHKADRVAHEFCQNLANCISLRGEDSRERAKFKTYDGAGQSSSSNDDEANTIEAHFDGEMDNVAIYINGRKQQYSCATRADLRKAIQKR